VQTAVRHLEIQDYQTTWRQMQDFTSQRDQNTEDELWIVEHPAVYTLGLNGQEKHILKQTDIPVIQTDRGGQVTYHGPGQLVIYTLFNMDRLKINIRQLVTILEQAMIDTLSQYGVRANSKKDAPGVYVAEKKMGSVGLRIKKGCSYHGLSLNNKMDLAPFNHINTCGFPGLEVTQLFDQGVNIRTCELAVPVTHAIIKALDKQ
jgi:lipoyl(octanoyl) transferase